MGEVSVTEAADLLDGYGRALNEAYQRHRKASIAFGKTPMTIHQWLALPPDLREHIVEVEREERK